MQLLEVVRRHAEVLSAGGLITDRPAWLMRTADGSVVEVFESMSPAAIERAHSSPVVQVVWAGFEATCDCVPVASPVELQQVLSEFNALAL